MHVAIDLSPICCTPMAIRISVYCVLAASDQISIRHGMGVHLSWFAPPPILTDVRLLLGVGSTPPTMGRSGILPWARFVPPTTGWSVSEVFSEGFCLWTGSGPPTCCRAFTIFLWKIGIMVVNDNPFQSQNYSIGALLLAPNCCREVRQQNIDDVFMVIYC